MEKIPKGGNPPAAGEPPTYPQLNMVAQALAMGAGQDWPELTKTHRGFSGGLPPPPNFQNPPGGPIWDEKIKGWVGGGWEGPPGPADFS